jgi:hypothetical protein
MKSFIFKFLTFLFFPTLFLGINFLLNSWFISSQSGLSVKSSVIIAGDSHLQTSVDPAMFHSANNISLPAEPAIATFLKLKFLFNQHTPDTLILGFSQHTISGFNDLKFKDLRWANEMFRRYYAVMNLDVISELEYDERIWQQTRFRYLCLYPHKNHFNFLGKFDRNNLNGKINFKGAIDRHFYSNGKLCGISQSSINAVDSIVKLCHEKKIFVVLVASPVHSSYFNAIPQIINDQFELEKTRYREKGIMVLDFSGSNYDDTLIMDADHLNGKGATIFTKDLITKLSEN